MCVCVCVCVCVRGMGRETRTSAVMHMFTVCIMYPQDSITATVGVELRVALRGCTHVHGMQSLAGLPTARIARFHFAYQLDNMATIRGLQGGYSTPNTKCGSHTLSKIKLLFNELQMHLVNCRVNTNMILNPVYVKCRAGFKVCFN